MIGKIAILVLIALVTVYTIIKARKYLGGSDDEQ